MGRTPRPKLAALTIRTMAPTQINPRDFPDSPYAQELQRSGLFLRFASALENEYSSAHLQRVRLRVRVWFTLVLVVRIMFELAQIRTTGAFSDASLTQLALLLPFSAFFAYLAWGSLYDRFYLKISAVLLPLFYSLISMFVVRAIASGQFEQFAAFAVALIAVYFFAGLKFREALLTNLCLLLSFGVSGHILGLVPFVLLKCLSVLTITSVLVAIVYRDIESSTRREFLEHALIGQMLTRDSLSGLMNRRAFDEHLRRVWLHALRQRCAIAVCMIDVDHFKRYNDAFGHQAGDLALSRIGSLIQEFARRPLDMAARYGGEEFSLILCDVCPEQIKELAERLRQRIQAERITQNGAADQEAGLTVSVGAAIVTPSVDRTPQGAVQLADEGLYEAKRAGRNRVVVKGADEHRLLDTGKFQAIRFFQARK
jgi:diguanylate cyclase (GGDEF)-like protein